MLVQAGILVTGGGQLAVRIGGSPPVDIVLAEVIDVSLAVLGLRLSAFGMYSVEAAREELLAELVLRLLSAEHQASVDSIGQYRRSHICL